MPSPWLIWANSALRSSMVILEKSVSGNRGGGGGIPPGGGGGGAPPFPAQMHLDKMITGGLIDETTTNIVC